MRANFEKTPRTAAQSKSCAVASHLARQNTMKVSSTLSLVEQLLTNQDALVSLAKRLSVWCSKNLRKMDRLDALAHIARSLLSRRTLLERHSAMVATMRDRVLCHRNHTMQSNEVLIRYAMNLYQSAGTELMSIKDPTRNRRTRHTVEAIYGHCYSGSCHCRIIAL
jgi:hypothetical protein